MNEFVFKLNQLNEINDKNVSTTDRIKSYSSILQEYLNMEHLVNAEDIIKAFVTFVVTKDTLVNVIGRNLMNTVISRIQSITSADLSISLLHYILDCVHSRLISFEDQVAQIRTILCHLYESQGHYLEAANALAGINIETSQKQYQTDFKLNLYLRIAVLYLNASEYSKGESYINRASIIQTDSNDITLETQLRVCQAQSFEFRKKYNEAAQRFNSLSTNITDISEDNRFHYFRRAVMCTVLSPGGEQRNRMLALFLKDDRCLKLPIYDILKNMCNERFISKDQLKILESFLNENQKTQAEYGLSTIELVTLEHNLLVFSKIYCNITIGQLSSRLCISESIIQHIVALMIFENRLDAKIDQIQNIILFVNEKPSILWDSHISKMCLDVNAVCTSIEDVYPQWYSENK